jgi:hypothetical protein
MFAPHDVRNLSPYLLDLFDFLFERQILLVYLFILGGLFGALRFPFLQIELVTASVLVGIVKTSRRCYYESDNGEVMQMFWDEATEAATQANKIEIAKNALKEGATVEFIKKITGLKKETIQQLQAELNNQ